MPPLAVDVRWREAPRADRRRVADALITGSLAEAGLPAVRLARVCAWCGGAHGAVRVTNADAVASVSYAGSLVVVATAVAPPRTPFGVDAERTDLDADATARLRAALGDDAADAAAWTRVEAALKADGRGLRVDPGTVTVAASASAGGEWAVTVPGRRAPLRVRTVPGPPGVAVSLATATAAAPCRPATR